MNSFGAGFLDLHGLIPIFNSQFQPISLTISWSQFLKRGATEIFEVAESEPQSFVEVHKGKAIFSWSKA